MHVYLLQSYDTDQLATEVIIGKDNLYTHIRDNREGSNVASADTTDILNCQEPRPFWLMWKDNHYYVGRGMYDVIFMLIRFKTLLLICDDDRNRHVWNVIC